MNGELPTKDSVPAKASCPKCGSDDIHRHFYKKDEIVENDVLRGYNKPAHPGFRVSPTTGCRSYAIRDVIMQHCRCCQFEWADKPLSKTKEKAA